MAYRNVEGQDSTREEVIAMFARGLEGEPKLVGQVGQLRGKALRCRCAPEPCHGDVLKAWADAQV